MVYFMAKIEIRRRGKAKMHISQLARLCDCPDRFDVSFYL